MFLSLYPKQCIFKLLGGAQHYKRNAVKYRKLWLRMILQLERKLTFKESEILSCMHVENSRWRDSFRSFLVFKACIVLRKKIMGRLFKIILVYCILIFPCNLYHVLVACLVWISLPPISCSFTVSIPSGNLCCLSFSHVTAGFLHLPAERC